MLVVNSDQQLFVYTAVHELQKGREVEAHIWPLRNISASDLEQCNGPLAIRSKGMLSTSYQSGDISSVLETSAYSFPAFDLLCRLSLPMLCSEYGNINYGASAIGSTARSGEHQATLSLQLCAVCLYARLFLRALVLAPCL